MALVREFDEIKMKQTDDAAGAKTRTWITRGHNINITYVRTVMKLLIIESEIRDMFQALKNVMLCVSYLKFATLRAKAMKTIKKVIKLNPENLNDKEIHKIISLVSLT